MSAKIISFANQKGGVGKTTTTIEVGENLSQTFHKKVLLIDLDPQASMTSVKSNMHQIVDQKLPTMSDVMLGNQDLSNIILNIKSNLDIAPATLVLSDAELNLVNATLRELILKKALSSVIDNYDYVLIDCPPSRGVLTVNALSASDYVVIPVQSEYQALLGMQLLKNTIKNVQSQINADLKVFGYVITMTSHTNHSNEVTESIKQDEYPTIEEIPRTIDVADAAVANMSTYEYNKNSKAGLEYLHLTKKIMKLGE
ncbi:sporulation initiation inhibitor protein Soj [Philodulcilactobacillus myokoensis]|uniref:Sporulation initiation inhibitor protein Soj n=1 Tax=Philodulcilactobacillus myokoensis TaxID=2929573 RepID=A0A9W6B2Q9_9LACO|nr:AAA family ATPase [Philodulcilactobacillus myokoensis]GLB47416.1 sporulation initiation inhibitor protein Soj [Philodulcilactobacillus myokoensis]